MGAPKQKTAGGSAANRWRPGQSGIPAGHSGGYGKTLRLAQQARLGGTALIELTELDQVDERSNLIALKELPEVDRRVGHRCGQLAARPPIPQTLCRPKTGRSPVSS